MLIAEKAFCIFVFSILGLVGNVQAQGNNPRFALLIGNDHYSESEVETSDRLHNLRNACNDVMEIAAKLQRIGWHEEDIDLRCDLTRSQITENIESFLDKVQTSDGAVAVFYFSGHGIQVGGNNYIFGINAKPDIDHAADTYLRDPKAALFGTDAVEINWYLISRLGASFTNAILLVLDACRENPLYDLLNRALIERKPIAGPTLDWVVSAMKVPKKLPHGIVTAFSTSDGDLADDGFGALSPYAESFSRVIRPGAIIDTILSDTANRVFQLTRGTAREQEPSRSGNFATPPDRCFAGCVVSSGNSGSLRNLRFASLKAWGLDGTFRRIARNKSVSGRQLVEDNQQAPGTVKTQSGPLPPTRTLLDQTPKDLHGAAKAAAVTTQLSLDVFWCTGDSYAESRRIAASELASSAATLARIDPLIDKAMMSRVQIKPIPRNADSKRVFDPSAITLEYSDANPTNLKWAQAIAVASSTKLKLTAAPDAATNNLAIFVCKDLDIDRRPQRVFMQVADASQDELARKIAKELRTSGQFWVASGVDVQPQSHPDTEVRYFFQEDRDAAKHIFDTTKGSALVAPLLVYLPDYQNKVARGTFEVWLGKKLVDQKQVVDGSSVLPKIIRIPDIDAKDGDGNVVAKLTNVSLSFVDNQKGPVDFELKYSFYNGSGTQKGNQNINLAFTGPDKQSASASFPLDRSRCVYGGPEARFNKGSSPVSISNVEMTVTRVTGSQGKC
jgi:hypothetical protein